MRWGAALLALAIVALAGLSIAFRQGLIPKRPALSDVFFDPEAV